MTSEETNRRTPVEIPKRTRPMRSDQRFVLLGSCFAQYMGERFRSEGIDSLCNPLGAAYNPESIAIQVRQALRGGDIGQTDSIFQFDGKWRCWWANTLLSDTDEARFRRTIEDTFSQLGNALRQADYLFVTLGTNVCYRLRDNGMTVANCHKVPARVFEEVTVPLEACIETLDSLLHLLAEECPQLQVVFTVSPYRYRKYGLHGSQLAKATLLLAADRVCKLHPEQAAYFPAYEILLDELRDYSFYAEDMIHPAPEAVDYIWHRLTETWLIL